jgi:hypothetical protein
MIWQVRLLAWLHIGIGGLGLLAGIILCTSLALTPTHESQEALAYVGGFFGFLVIPLLVPALAGGIGLLRRETGGRVLILVLSSIYLLMFPIGTALGIFSFWTLLSAEGRRCFHRGDKAALDQPNASTIAWQRGIALFNRTIAANPILGLLLAMMLVAAGFVLVLAIGFRRSGQPAPGMIDDAVPAAVIFLMPAIIFGGIAMMGRWHRQGQRNETSMQAVPAWKARRDKRIAEIDTDPVKQKYIPLIAGGEDWSDAQIAYNEDPDMAVTCQHLQPIERDLRRSGIRVRWLHSMTVSAKCGIDRATIERHYRLVPPTYYVEDYQGERDARDYPTAFFSCKTCLSAISVMHPDQTRSDTPIFPASSRANG